MSNVVINGFLATDNPEAVLEDAQIREPENLFFIDVNLGKDKIFLNSLYMILRTVNLKSVTAAIVLSFFEGLDVILPQIRDRVPV